MKNIKIFATLDDINTFIHTNIIKTVGYGSEGYTYLAKDGSVLKEIRPSYVVPYDNSIITTSDFNLESFIFPDELYIYNEMIYGYKMKYFKNDVFADIYRNHDVEINLEKLIEARRKAINDIEELTQNGYGIDDTIGNVLFDGERIALIDTLCYVKDLSSLEVNINQLDKALDLRLYKMDPLTAEWNMPFENKVRLLMRKNRSNKVVLKPLGK